MAEAALQVLVPMVLTCAWLVVLAPVARRIGLVDRPSGRKRHNGDIPIIGGVAIAMTLLTGLMMLSSNATFAASTADIDIGLFVILGCYLVLVGIIDDKIHLSVKTRIFSELLFGALVIELLDLKLSNLGNLIGLGDISISGPATYVVTLIAIFGLINAVNMLDGIDGLVASLLMTTIIGFHVFTSTAPDLISFYLLGTVFAFLTSNLNWIPFMPKTFLGDAGSKLIGFIAVSSLIFIASDRIGGAKLIPPVTALFAVSIPLFDMVYVTIKRAIQGASPLSPARDHIHHLLSNYGFSDGVVVLSINSIHLSIMALGFTLNRAGAPEPSLFLLFLILFFCYYLILDSGWSRLSLQQR